MPAPTVLLVCSGLGHVQRGFETFTLECHDALRGRRDVRVVLGRAPSLGRDGRAARLAGRALRRDPYVIEQHSHAAALLPQLARVRPDVVFFCDWALGRDLGRARGRRRFRMLLHNGAPGWPPFGDHVDHVQHPTPILREVALRDPRERPERHTVLPIGMRVPGYTPVSAEQRRALRERLGLPADGRIVLSVAALNMWHKRLDYVIDEVASLPAPRPHLVMVGHPDAETPAVRARANERLGPAGFTMRTVPRDQVADHYRAADVFVHGSILEGFGVVLLEALAHGLPVVAHENPGIAWILGDAGEVADLSVPGELARRIETASADDGRGAQRNAHVRERFSWDVLTDRYAELMVRCADA